jgi:hypothetical protein
VTTYTATVLSNDDTDSVTVEVEPAIPDSGVSRYEFEEDLTDSWGSNDATSSGGITYASDGPVGTYAVSLDGSDDEVSFGPITISPPYSYSFWAKPTDSTTNTYWLAVLNSSDDDSGSVIYNFTTNEVEYFGANDGTRFTIDTVSAPASSYKLYTVTHSGSSVTTYVNGSQTNAASQSQPTIEIRYLGRSLAGNNAPLDADDVRIYDKELSSTEVSDLYNTGSI